MKRRQFVSRVRAGNQSQGRQGVRPGVPLNLLFVADEVIK
jgi:hypothetical protein